MTHKTTGPAAPMSRRDAPTKMPCARRSADTDTPAGVVSGPLAAGSAVMRPQPVGLCTIVTIRP